MSPFGETEDGRYVFSVMALEGGGTKWAGEVAENRCCWTCGQC